MGDYIKIVKTTVSYDGLRIKEVPTKSGFGEIFDFPFIRCYLLLRAMRLSFLSQLLSISDRTEEYLPGPKPVCVQARTGGEEVIKYSTEQVGLINQLVKINVSKVTAENLIKNNDQALIKKWIEAINYTNAEDKAEYESITAFTAFILNDNAAHLVKAIRENWQFPEEYLRERKEEEQKEEREKTEVIKIKLQEEENKKRQKEIKRMGQIYSSLTPSQQEEIKRETENRLPEFWKAQFNKERIKGKTSKMLEVVLEEKRREIIKHLMLVKS